MFPKLLFCTLISMFSLLATGQGQDIRTLEQEIRTAEGIDRITKRLELSDLYMAKNEFKVAERLATGAYQLAKFDDLPQLMAEARIRSSKAHLALGQKRQARQDINESISLLENVANSAEKTLALQEMKAIAKAVDNQNILEKVERELATIEALNYSSGSKASNSSNPEDGIINIEAELRKADEKMDKQLRSLNVERAELQQRIQSQAQEIQMMNAEQMRQQLTLAKQQQLLDSLSLKGLRDSLNLASQEIVLQQQKTQRNLFLGLAGAALVIVFGMFTRYRGIKRYNNLLEAKNHIIEDEKRRSDDLLLNILPSAVATELKNRGKAKTRHYDLVTVMFLDFKDFSKISRRLTPDELVAELDACFRAIDQIIDKYNLEKIKTIGDAYMCAGGLPDPDKNHAKRMVLAALEIQNYLGGWNEKRINSGLPPFEARISIHTGPIVAGVVGMKKFAYDIWGDSVNIAARMESASEAGRINISKFTHDLIQKDFTFDYRGKVPVKNIGEVEMYFVEGSRETAPLLRN